MKTRAIAVSLLFAAGAAVNVDSRADSTTLPAAPMADNEAVAQKETVSLQCPAVPTGSGTEIETEFIDALFERHQEALMMIDNRPVATDTTASDKWHPTQTREGIAVRLKKARALRVD